MTRGMTLLVGLMCAACCGCTSPSLRRFPRTPSAAEVSAAYQSEVPEDPPVYDLRIALDPAVHEITVQGTIHTTIPRQSFFLNPALKVLRLRDGDHAIGFERAGDRVQMDGPHKQIEIQYRGRLAREGEDDTKGSPWIEQGRVRLTEVTLWYPVFYRGKQPFPWPPEPARGSIWLLPQVGLQWIVSGQETAKDSWEIHTPTDIVLIGTSLPTQVVPGPWPNSRLRVVASHGRAIADPIRCLVASHAAHLDRLPIELITVVEFPNGSAAARLAFVSSNTAVLSTSVAEALAQKELAATKMVSHELAHLWFNASLRPEGPLTAWLSEGFAEYYGWTAVGRCGADGSLQAQIAAAKQSTGDQPVSLRDLGLGDDRVRSYGALAVHELANMVGQQGLDEAIRDVQIHQGAWSGRALAAALLRGGLDPDKLDQFRARWGWADP